MIAVKRIEAETEGAAKSILYDCLFNGFGIAGNIESLIFQIVMPGVGQRYLRV